MYLEINPVNPDKRKVTQVIDCLLDGGVIIYPTDTVYGFGCDITNKRAVERICQLRGIDASKVNLSFICEDLSQASAYAHQIDNRIFRMLNRYLPGPYTFILRGSNELPKLFRNRKRTFGLRIPDHPICREIVRELGRPLLSASVKKEEPEDEMDEYYSDPLDIRTDFEKRVDLIVDGGPGGLIPSTLVDCTEDPPVLVRQGLGQLDAE